MVTKMAGGLFESCGHYRKDGTGASASVSTLGLAGSRIGKGTSKRDGRAWMVTIRAVDWENLAPSR